MRQFQGIPASPGVVLGPAFRYERIVLDVPRATGRNVEAEWARLEAAASRVREELARVRERAEREIGKAEADRQSVRLGAAAPSLAERRIAR